LPLVLFVAARRKRVRIVMLGHFVSKPWKWRTIRAASLLKHDVTLAVHSVVQQRSAERASRGRWRVPLIPYQVDTGFWQRQSASAPEIPASILAVGSEHRDYATLVEAVSDLPVQLTIAAGSHWARETSDVATLPANVHLFTEPFTFAELREMYASATVVVVPLEDVPNQSGITVMLESMAMGVPVIATATRGQRECVAGPLVQVGAWSCEPLPGRGPQHFGASTTVTPNGLYVSPGDVAGLRAAILKLTGDLALRRCIAANGRRTVEETFTLENYVANLARLVEGVTDE
jgi:glycosyltransferase involved in cell wall biosynthesis